MKGEIEYPEDRLSETVKKNLDRVVENRLNKEYDFVLLILGKVGDGKTTLAALGGAYVSTKTGVPFTVENVFFTSTDYKTRRVKIKPKASLDFDEGEECFYSRRAMTKGQRDLILQFAQIRQKNHFITICAPSLFLLEKWLRGIGTETRIDCIWRILRRGKFLCYSSNTGKLQKIKIEHGTNKIVWPESDFTGYWKPIPKQSDFWRDYLKRKGEFLKGKRENIRITKMRKKMEKKLSDSLTISDIAEINDVHVNTVRKWIKELELFGKRGVFVDLSGKIRVDVKSYEGGIKRYNILKQKRLRRAKLRRRLKGRK